MGGLLRAASDPTWRCSGSEVGARFYRAIKAHQRRSRRKSASAARLNTGFCKIVRKVGLTKWK